MENEYINEEKIEKTLRSVFRYNELVRSSGPEMLIETEADILQKRVKDLSPHEIFAVITLWPEYLTQQTATDAEANQEFEKYLTSLN